MDSDGDLQARLQASLARLDASFAGLTAALEELGRASIRACEAAVALVESSDGNMRAPIGGEAAAE